MKFNNMREVNHYLERHKAKVHEMVNTRRGARFNITIKGKPMTLKISKEGLKDA